ncbi:hypothetical protein FRC02_005955 [Tulasnella sp. 418]|nr:hypothetical protein FRC02_005955 [Tulasnella sp. 418]
MHFRHFLIAVGTYLLTINAVLALPNQFREAFPELYGGRNGLEVTSIVEDPKNPINILKTKISDSSRDDTTKPISIAQLVEYRRLRDELDLAERLIILVAKNTQIAPPAEAYRKVIKAKADLWLKVRKWKEQKPLIGRTLDDPANQGHFEDEDSDDEGACGGYCIKIVHGRKMPKWSEGMREWMDQNALLY